MKKVLFILFFIFANFACADELIISSDYKILRNNEGETTKQNEKYSYNEPEDEPNSNNPFKLNYDVNLKKTKMTVGIKGFSFKIPF